MKKILIALLSVASLAGCQSAPIQSVPTTGTASSSVSTSSSAAWKEFQNEKYGIKFSVPGYLSIEPGEEQSLPKYTSFTLAEFQRPDVKMRNDYEAEHPEEHIDSGSSPSDLIVRVHNDYMHTNALDNIFWLKKDETYTDLDDFFSKPHLLMQGVKKRTVSGVTGYEVYYSSSFVFVVPHRGNLFEFQMPYIGDMTGTMLTADSDEDKILQSIELN